MLGVDRLDLIKGIPQKLLAFEKFLQEHPEWRDKVLLVQVSSCVCVCVCVCVCARVCCVCVVCV